MKVGRTTTPASVEPDRIAPKIFTEDARYEAMCRSCLKIIPTYRKTDARHAFGNASCGMNTNRHTKSCPTNSCSDTVQ